ncbi:MAG: hypothetical protein IJU69_07345 [Bacteroidales bacterium]|nr:hypothetical protein [Bacteroidales bacterium]
MKRTVLIILALAFACKEGAQNFNTGFFLDNYCYGARINPALQYKEEYVGAIFNNICISENATVGAGNFLFPSDGQLVTGLHPSIPASQFLSGLKRDNSLGIDADYTLYSQAVKKEKYRFVIEVMLKSYHQLSLPYELFALAKNGSSATPYDLSRTRIDSRNYLEGSYVYSRQVVKGLTVGGRAKLMMGLASASLQAEKMDVTANAERWEVNSNARLLMSAPFMSLVSREDTGETGFAWDARQLHPCGVGVGVDLGAVYTPVKGLTLSLSVLDIGCIWWHNNINSSVVAAESFSGISGLSLDGSSIPEEVGKVIEKFGKAFTLKSDNPIWKAEGLPTTFNFGARYAMPFYDKLSVGLHASIRSFANVVNSDFRLGATISPVEWFSFTTNYGFGSNGSNFGAALAIGGKPVNFFIGGEIYTGRTGQAAGVSLIPLAASHNMLNFGLSFTY